MPLLPRKPKTPSSDLTVAMAIIVYKEEESKIRLKIQIIHETV